MNTVCGLLADQLGHAAKSVLEQGPDRPELRLDAWATPAGQVAAVQADTIPVDLDHDRIPCGELVYLERSGGKLWAVAHVADRVQPAVRVRVGGRQVSVATELYWSASTRGAQDFAVESVALTATPARIAAHGYPVRFLPGQLDHRRAPDRWPSLSRSQRGLLERAAVAHLDRIAHGGPIVVHDRDDHDQAPAGLATRQARPLETRSATTTAVSLARRIIELVVMPYETETVVEHRGRIVREIVSRDAFAGIERQTNRVRVNRDHDVRRTVGRAVHFDPRDPRGLVAEIRIAATELGEETLTLADEGLLDASAGFAVQPGGERWERRDRRRLSALWLGHIALVANPAYEDARVLAVRGRDAGLLLAR
jgi:HK97 family phage prohead protease